MRETMYPKLTAKILDEHRWGVYLADRPFNAWKGVKIKRHIDGEIWTLPALCKVQILKGAMVVIPERTCGRKIRTDKIKVLEVQRISGKKIRAIGHSPIRYTGALKYRAGNEVTSSLNIDIRRHCAQGIHICRRRDAARSWAGLRSLYYSPRTKKMKNISNDSMTIIWVQRISIGN